MRRTSGNIRRHVGKLRTTSRRFGFSKAPDAVVPVEPFIVPLPPQSPGRYQSSHLNHTSDIKGRTLNGNKHGKKASQQPGDANPTPSPPTPLPPPFLILQGTASLQSGARGEADLSPTAMGIS